MMQKYLRFETREGEQQGVSWEKELRLYQAVPLAGKN